MYKQNIQLDPQNLQEIPQERQLQQQPDLSPHQIQSRSDLCLPILSILIMTVLLNLMINLWKVDDSNKIKPVNQIGTAAQNTTHISSVQLLDPNPINQEHAHTIPQTVHINPTMSQRINLAQPTHKISYPTLILITKTSLLQPSLSLCYLINSLNQPLHNSLPTLNNLLTSSSNIHSILLYITYRSNFNQSYSKIMQKYAGNYTIRIVYQVEIDSDYRFVLGYVGMCRKVVYFHQKVQVNGALLESEIMKMGEAMVGYSLCQGEQERRNLEINLELIKEEQLSKHIFIFDTQLLKLITPINFAYYTLYTLDQLIIFPILALTQNSPNLIQITNLHHKCPKSSLNSVQFPLMSPPKSQNSLCFVSYPSNPQFPDEQQFFSYLQSLTKMKASNKISIIVYVPYRFSQYKLSKWVEFLLISMEKNQISRVKVRVMANQTVSSHAVYESAYLYCPNQSIIVASRHNVQFGADFVVNLSKAISKKQHYYHVAHQEKESGNIASLGQPLHYREPYFVRNNPALYRNYFQHVQIFKSDLIKSTPFWVLKSGELQFYQTEAVFFIYMMESIRLAVHFINETLIKVQARNESVKQKQQIENLQQYVEYSQLPGSALIPYQYNCLENEAYKRNAPDLIERIVHQIWIGSPKISKIRMRLHKTISQHNPKYEVKLWRNQNITRENFPLTYQIVSKTFQYQKSSKRSYYALAADLLRYQVLYQHGGIYLDFKMQVLKPLDAFLKYQIFFIDAGVDSSRLKSPTAVGVGIIGAMKNSYYFRTALAEIILESGIDYKNQFIPAMTGGVVVRKVFTDKQLFTVVGFGYHLFIPRPSVGGINDCGKVGKFDPDQQIFQIPDPKVKKIYKVGIPCKQYSQAYILSYKPLASSWKGNKRNMN